MESLYSMRPLLTIAIPTYNRPVQLRHTLAAILPQIRGEPRVRLLVLDNHSDLPAAQVLAELTGAEENASVVRHAFNIGGGANIMRCFELCETEWLWVLCDDDEPSPTAVQTILNDTAGPHVFAFYCFPTSPLPKPIPSGRMPGRTIETLFNAIHHCITPLTLLSASIYRIGTLRKRLPIGYACMSSGVSHLAMVFAEIEAGGAWLISDRTICDYQPPEPGQSWMVHSIFLALPVAYLSFQKPGNLDHFRRAMQVAHGPCPEFLLVNFIRAYAPDDFFSLRSAYLFRIMRAFYEPCGWLHPFVWAKWRLATIASFFPSLFLLAVRGVCRMIGRPVPCAGSRDRD